MSLTQVAETIGTLRQNVANFLTSKRLKSLQGIAYTPQENDSVEVDSSDQMRGGTRISPVPLGLAAVFWYFQAKRGNKPAETLTIHGLYDSLLRRADEAFGIVRTMEEYNRELAGLRQSLTALAEEYERDDMARELTDEAWRVVEMRDREIERLKDKIRELGGNPDD